MDQVKLSHDQVLQQAVSAHKEGNLHEAEKLYRSILKALPQHPDANHNLGVLAASLNQVEPSLLLFQNALEANPKIEQFWLSLLNALIKAEKFEAAKEVISRSKHQGMYTDKIEALEKNGVESPNQQQLDKLLATYHAGQFDEAEAFANSLTQDFPQHAFAWKVLGAILNQTGRINESVVTSQKALSLEPRDAEIHNNLGISLHELKRFGEAEIILKQAIRINSDYAEAHFNLGNIFKALSKLTDAEASFRRATVIKPDYAEAYTNLGVVLKEQGKFGDAQASCKRAIEINPGIAESHSNLGLIFFERDSIVEAIECFAKAVELKPEEKEFHSNLAIALSNYNAQSFSTDLEKMYIRVLDQISICRPQDLARSIIVHLKHNEVIREALVSLDKKPHPHAVVKYSLLLSEIPSLLKIIELCPIPDLEFEALFIKLRCALLLEQPKISCSEKLLRFQTALALHCFTNEFIFQETAQETFAVEMLESHIETSFSKGRNFSYYEIACLASYRSLEGYAWAENIEPPSVLQPLFERQVSEVRREQYLRETIPRFSIINDEISLAVQDQYEENPYPRWVNTKIENTSRSIPELASQIGLRLNESTFDESYKILVAGCGTGEQSISTASRFSNSNVVAVDLSMSSLCYAKRKTDELGIKNIEYRHADILDLDMGDERFDIIECVGVLHHTAAPFVGMENLSRLLKTGGLMKIGLYSQLARQHIAELRTKIAEKDISPNRKDMLSFRQGIIEGKSAIPVSLLYSPDFYSVSMLRDLLFHVKEHCFSLPEISEMLVKLNLSFSGFEFKDKKPTEYFRQSHPELEDLYNLSMWHKHEILHPDVFSGMYLFWAQKL